MKHQYFVAGMRVTSDQPIPGLNTQGHADAAITLRIGWAIKPNNTDCYMYPDNESPLACIRRDGQAIWLRQADAVILRQVVPFAAALQGKITLHAAAVCCYRELAFAFVGASGAGKSTLARALSGYGLTVLADDLLACREVDGQIVALEGQRPLAAIYFLRRNHLLTDPQVSALTKKQGLQSLIVHGFGELRVSYSWAAQFSFYRQVVDAVRLFDLVLPDSLDRLPAVIDTLMAHWRATL